MINQQVASSSFRLLKEIDSYDLLINYDVNKLTSHLKSNNKWMLKQKRLIKSSSIKVLKLSYFKFCGLLAWIEHWTIDYEYTQTQYSPYYSSKGTFVVNLMLLPNFCWWELLIFIKLDIIIYRLGRQHHSFVWRNCQGIRMNNCLNAN